MNAPLPSMAVSAEHPFPGLRPFAYQDHAYFFGREEQTYTLYRLIDRFRFIAVVGSSGSGKSSLVRAGLLPLLDAETREAGGRNWLWREMRPGDAPLQRLTTLLASLSMDSDPIVAAGRRGRIAAQLQRSSFGISEALADTSGVADRSLVLVIDQFEELFRYAATAVGETDLSGDEVRARDEATQFVQLLLEASRAPALRIHVMLTMRSDFIGDCARFHGLPEAVCAAQFLVPSLTRDQLDEVIRRPIAQAGATIDPELVERMLNDCGTDMDQLPVLQHCLSRLWDEAGKVATTTPGAAPPGPVPAVDTGPARHLSMQHYRNIGEFADALSRHADAVLKDLSGPTLQLAVSQSFSALSELDKEGRAIRRAVRFSQLVEETGVDPGAVRQVLDRFRADDCCFLMPSPSEVEAIDGTTRIDVAHEALLRRWEKVSGQGADLGWLRAEQQAGERYRSLLAMAEGNDAVLPSHLVDERLAWWKARPRTSAWAERYGGGFQRVQRLLLASQRRQHAKRLAIAAAFVTMAAIAGVMAWLYWAATNAQFEANKNLRAAVQAQSEANARRRDALQATQISIGRLAGFLNDGTIRAVGAQQFLDDAKATLEQLSKAGDHSPEISEIELSLLLAVADVRDSLGDSSAALDVARQAEQLSQHYVDRYPDDPKFKHLLYASKFRVGDQLANHVHDKDDIRKAEEEYLAAVGIAKQLASSAPGNSSYQHEVAFLLNKVGDAHQSRHDWQGAIEQYEAGLEIARSITAQYPGDIATQTNRIAQATSERGQPGDHEQALSMYREALRIEMQQLEKNTDNASLISNIALTHRRIGLLLKNAPDQARLEFKAAVDRRGKLYASDPGNKLWRTSLATDLTLLGDVLMQQQKSGEALQDYDSALPIEEGIVASNPEDLAWQKNLAALNVRRGDALIDRGNEVLAHPEPVLDESRRLIDQALARYRAAAETFGKLADDPKAAAAQVANVFDVQIKIGDVLVRQDQYTEALAAYQSASATIGRAAPIRRVVDWQVRLAVSLEQAGDFLADKTEKDAMTDQPAGSAGAQAYYQKAFEAIEAASTREPGNPDVLSKKLEIATKRDTPRASSH
jgi:tetratricopeptide (TPR) repeat protein